MSIKTFIAASALALAAGVQAAPHPITLEVQGSSYSAGLSTQAGSSMVTRTEAGAFRDEFLIRFNGLALVNAWLETSADLAYWSNQGITFTRAGFVGVNGSELTFDNFELNGTLFTFGFTAPFLAQGDFVFFVEGVAGAEGLQQPQSEALFNSFSYSGGVNVQPQATDLPEPASVGLAAVALAGVLATRRRRRND